MDDSPRARFSRWIRWFVPLAVAYLFAGYPHGVSERNRPAAGATPIPTSLAAALTADVNAAATAAARIGDVPLPAFPRPAIVGTSDVVLEASARHSLAIARFPAWQLQVKARGGTLTLDGTVASPDERNRALRVARETPGVRRVVDRLVVAGTARTHSR